MALDRMDLIWEGIDWGIGILHQGLARLLPLRPRQPRPEIAWDAAGILVTTVASWWTGAWLDEAVGQLAELPGFAAQDAVVSAWPAWLSWGLFFVTADFLTYWAHRLLHGPGWWHVHAWHHSPRILYWASGLRGSPVHVLLLLAPSALAALLVHPPDIEALLTGVALFDIANQHYLHSNIRWPGARHIERVLVTSRFHFVHHSARAQLANSNYGFVFTWWDRLFGTYTDPDSVAADDPLGLGYAIPNWRLLAGLPPARHAAADRSPGS
jgi:sterol desaturase/sphingolipid hydroxylase (fatty acid hydroxylase superfamily)